MIIAFCKLEDWEKETIKDSLKKHKLIFLKEDLNINNVNKIKTAEILVCSIYSEINKEVIDKIPNLKFITTLSTGFDHIDLSYCREKRILVSNVPTYGENTVAEHTFSLILALSRKLYSSIKRTHEQKSFTTDESLRGFDLKEKKLGIIGLGNIGENVARIGVGFEMEVLVFTRSPNKKMGKKLGIKFVSLTKLLKESDIITLHLPYNKKTHHMISKESINKMKKGVYVINTARGGLINILDLIKALKKGKIAGAALDVLEEEKDIKEEKELLQDHNSKCDFYCLLENHKLMQMQNVIITPHNAFNSSEALKRIIDSTIENISSFLKGKPKNKVN